MAWTFEDVVTIAPEFADVPEETIDIYIAMATRWISETYFGNVSDDAGKFLTAHLMTMLIPPGEYNAGITPATGPVTQKSVGDVSVSYGGLGSLSLDSIASRTTLALTRYGLLFYQLVRMRGPAAQVL